MSTLTPGGTLQDNLFNLQGAGVPVVVGSENYGQNLLIRSTNNSFKGAVVLDEATPAYGPNSGALQLNGGLSAQHNVAAGGVFLNTPYGQSVINVVMFQQGSYGTQTSITVGSNVYSFSATPTVTFSAPQIPGGVTAQGYAVMQSNVVVQVVVTNPGTGYTIPPTVTFSDPTPTANTVSIVATVGTTVTNGQFVKAFQSGGAIYYYIVTSGAIITSNPTFSSGSSSAAGPTMTFVGALAQGYVDIGYTGALMQGATQSLGCVTQVVITAAGSSYAQAPEIIFSRPDYVGGRTATAIAQLSGNAITKIDIIDPGTGYIYPPTVTINPKAGGGSGATAVAVIGAPTTRAVISNMSGYAYTGGSYTSYAPVTQAGTYANKYAIDFSHQGNEVVFIQTAVSISVYFDSINNDTSGFQLKHGYAQGRKVTVYVKNTSGGAVTVTFPNLQGTNSSTGTNNPSISATRTGRFEFMVLGNTNYQTAATPPLSIDVFGTFITS